MAEYKLNLKKRELTGKKLKSLRREGIIPSVVYGEKELVLTASDYVETEKILKKAGYHSPIDLDIDGKKRIAIVKNVAFDPVSRKIVNIEFLAVSAKEAVEATTPVVVVKFEESEAAKVYHYVLSRQIDEIDVKAKPSDLPKELIVDASAMKGLEDRLTVSDIKLPEGVEFADKELDPEQVVASLYDPVAEAERREAEDKNAEAVATETTLADGGEGKTEAEGDEK